MLLCPLGLYIGWNKFAALFSQQHTLISKLMVPDMQAECLILHVCDHSFVPKGPYHAVSHSLPKSLLLPACEQ